MIVDPDMISMLKPEITEKRKMTTTWLRPKEY